MKEIIEFSTSVRMKPLIREQYDALHNDIKDIIIYDRAKNNSEEINSNVGEIDWDYYDNILDRIADWCNENEVDFVELINYYHFKDIISGNYNILLLM